MRLELQRKTSQLDAMTALPPDPAAELLARLRLGEFIESIIEPYVPMSRNSGACATAAESLSQPQRGLTVLYSTLTTDEAFSFSSSGFSESAISLTLLSSSVSSLITL